MASVLSNILISDKETKDAIVNVDNTLTKMYADQVKQNKIENEREKRRQQNEKRDKADSPIAAFLKANKEEDKKKKKGLLESLLGGMGGLGGIVSSAVLLKVLGIGAIGAAIAAYIGNEDFRNFVNENIFKPLRTFMEDTVFPWLESFIKDTLVPFVMDNLVTPIKDIIIGESEGLFGEVGAKLADELADAVAKPVKEAIDENLRDPIQRRLSDPLGTAREILGGAPLTTPDTMSDLRDAWETINQKRELSRGTDITAEEDIKEVEKLLKKSERLASLTSRIESDIKVLTAEDDYYRKGGKFKSEARKEQFEVFAEGIKKQMNDDLYEITETKKKIMEAHGDFLKKYKITPDQFLQKGGPVDVPGTGSGDKVPMLLPSNSFVMNREAVRRQGGGMVPTLLEPGEQVYMPGQWGAQHMLMNSAFPRFQEGGQVSHNQTGTGYQPSGAKDYKGRPVVLSKPAAESFKEMMSSGGVKGTDVTSSQRSVDYNSQIGGAQNSNHLYGNAMDIHGSSKAWLKGGNAERYGWRLLDPSFTSHDGHFDYIGRGSEERNTPTVKEKKEKVEPGSSYPKLEKTGGGMFLPKIGGALGMLLQGIQGAFNEVFAGTALESIGMGGIDGMSPEPTSGTTTVGPPPPINALASGGDNKDKAILDMIASVEADKRDEYGGFNTSAGATAGRATDKTIGWLSKNAKGAIGRYQHMPRFLLDRAKAAGYSEDTKFTPEVQDNMTIHFLKQDTGGMYEKWKAGKVSNESMGDELSRIWRGLPHSSGGTYPDQYASRNAAHMSRSAMMAQMTDITKLQQGGSVNFSGGSYNRSNIVKSEDEFIKRFSAAQQPMIVPVPLTGSSGGSAPASTGGNGAPPTLSAVPSTNVAMDSAYRLSIGAAFA